MTIFKSLMAKELILLKIALEVGVKKKSGPDIFYSKVYFNCLIWYWSYGYVLVCHDMVSH